MAFEIVGVGKTGNHPRVCLIRDRKVPDAIDPTSELKRVGLVLDNDGKENVLDLTTLTSGMISRLIHIYEQRKPVDLLQAIIGTKSQRGLGQNTYPVSNVTFAPPIDLDSNTEVWCAGVTYESSRIARNLESKAGDQLSPYDKVYPTDVRPELFFKATPRRVRGPNEEIQIPSYTKWIIPECEFGIVFNSRGEFVGITICDDVSCRDTEGENPLYLPRAKIFKGSFAMGPVISLSHEDTDQDARSLEITMDIERGSASVFKGSVSFSKMRRSIADLGKWLFLEDTFPDGVILSTGTGVIPPDDFCLQDGDIVRISVPQIGTLETPVVKSKAA